MPVKKVQNKDSAKTSPPSKKKSGPKANKKWSKKVNETSDALDLEKDIFKSHSAEKIAASLKASAERSTRKKTTPFQSAMSMLNFYENRAGKNLSADQKKVLEKAKIELRKLFGRDE